MGSKPGPSSLAGSSHGSCRLQDQPRLMDQPRLNRQRPGCGERGGTRARKLEEWVKKKKFTEQEKIRPRGLGKEVLEGSGLPPRPPSQMLCHLTQSCSETFPRAPGPHRVLEDP